MNINLEAMNIFDKARVLGGGKKSPGICVNSNDVEFGDIFVVQTGASAFVEDAFDRGAVLSICEDQQDFREELARLNEKYPERICFVRGLDTLIYELLDIAYGDAIRKTLLVGVTGTNGKTSTAWFACGLLSGMGIKTGYIGTLGHGVYGEEFQTGRNTTPENITLKRNIANLHQQGCSIVIIEVSSHGISLQRIAGLDFKAAVFTNLSRDHLDFHKSMEAYKAVKKSFFIGHKDRLPVINVDDSVGRKIVKRLVDEGLNNIFTFAVKGAAGNLSHHLSCKSYTDDGMSGYHLELGYMDELVEADFHVAGQFNIENLMAAVSLCCALGYSITKTAYSINNLISVPGRMECLRTDGKPKVCIDYAHTPDGIQNVLKRTAETDKQWCIFGCGGDRDKGKREEMGDVASTNSDHTVICDDNVRTEVAESILIDIAKGVKNKKGLIICRDRSAAFGYVMDQAETGEVVYLLGKGDERFSDYGVSKLNIKDIDIVTKYMGLQ